MSMDHTGPATGVAGGTNTDDESDGSLFAATPVWERGKKKRGFGRSRTAKPAASAAATGAAVGGASTVPPEPRNFDEPSHVGSSHMEATRAASLRDVDGDGDVDAARNGGLVAPIGRRRDRTTTTRARKSSGMVPAAVALGVLALGAVGVAGWYATSGDDGVAELTPGTEIAASEPLAATPPIADATAMMDGTATASTAPAATGPAATASATTERAQPTRVARASSRARPAAAATTTTSAASATEAGIDASGTAELPEGPVAYSTLNPDSSATAAPVIPSTPAISPPPLEATPAEPSATPAPETTTQPTIEPTP